MRLLYRTRQFFGGLSAHVSDADLRQADRYLPPAAQTWFRSLPRDLQWHGLQVMADLQLSGVDRSEVLAAALLHDAGKAATWSGPVPRALAVLLRKLAPGWTARRSQRDWRSARGLDRLVAVAAQHPQIAAEQAERYGCNPVTVELIRCHQDYTQTDDPMLTLFQQVDDRH